MTKLSEIPRVKAGTSVGLELEKMAESSSERAMLGRRAMDLLGYSALLSDVTGSVNIPKDSGPLQSGLLSLGIEVLDSGSVVRYQLEEIARRNTEEITARFKDWATGWFHGAEWAKTNLGSYTQPIPEFVINKAVQIKEQVPMTEFFVQHLNQPKADPFLVAKLGDEIYYIEAWDEPRFEGRFSE